MKFSMLDGIVKSHNFSKMPPLSEAKKHPDLQVTL